MIIERISDIAPKTLKDYHEFIFEMFGETLPQPNSILTKDYRGITQDRRWLIILASVFITLRRPFQRMGVDCFPKTVKRLIEKCAKTREDLEPIFSAVDQTYQTLRLLEVAANSIKPRVVTRPKTENDIKLTVAQLSGSRSPHLPSIDVEEYLIMVFSALRTAQDSETKKLLLYLSEAHFFHILRPSFDRWPLISQLSDRGYQFLLFLQKNKYERHADIIEQINLKKRTVRTFGAGEINFVDLQKGMEQENFPIICIPPLEVAPPDEKEIGIFRKLYF